MAVTPLGRWVVLPWQRINAGESCKIGVLAFSKAGITNVSFAISGQGYGGSTPVTVSSMTYDADTDCYAYWTTIACDDFATDGAATIEATITGGDAATRDKNTDGGGQGLDAFSLQVNPNGTLGVAQAWVSTTGNDATAEVNNQSLPYATCGNAATAIQTWRNGEGHGNNADGGEILLMAGDHYLTYTNSPGAITCTNEWLTIKPASGQSKSTVSLQVDWEGNVWYPHVTHLKIQDVTLNGAVILNCTSAGNATDHIWIDQCDCIGGGRTSTYSYTVQSNWYRIYWTDSYITACNFATGQIDGSQHTMLCRGLTVEAIGDDAFQNSPFVYNCTVDDIDPGVTGWHSDVCEGYPIGVSYTQHNRIYCNIKATDAHYQGFWMNTFTTPAGSEIDGVAFVNCLFELQNTIPEGGGNSGWYFNVAHFIMWHNTLINSDVSPPDIDTSHLLLFHADGIPQEATVQSDFSVIGNIFDGVQVNTSDLTCDTAEASWTSNHFGVSSGANIVTPGTDTSTGAYTLDANFKPTTGGALDNRVTQVVPFDVNNDTRKATGALGAVEADAATLGDAGGIAPFARHSPVEWYMRRPS